MKPGRYSVHRRPGQNWTVETPDGEVTIFVGPKAEERAGFYAGMMNQREFNAEVAKNHENSEA